MLISINFWKKPCIWAECKSKVSILSIPAIERIEKSSLSSLVVTDSISIIAKIKESTKIRIVPTAPLFAQALLNIANGNSVSSLFDSERLRPIYKPYYPKYNIEKKRKA